MSRNWWHNHIKDDPRWKNESKRRNTIFSFTFVFKSIKYIWIQLILDVTEKNNWHEIILCKKISTKSRQNSFVRRFDFEKIEYEDVSKLFLKKDIQMIPWTKEFHFIILFHLFLRIEYPCIDYAPVNTELIKFNIFDKFSNSFFSRTKMKSFYSFLSTRSFSHRITLLDCIVSYGTITSSL